jgi:hypothetical protein
LTMSREETNKGHSFFPTLTRDEKAQKTVVQQWQTSWITLIELRTT